jgi:hypothetical protein
MGNMEVPTNNQQVIKMPLGTYEFGANLVSNQVHSIFWWAGLLKLLHGNTLLNHCAEALCGQLREHAQCRADAGQHDDRPRLDGWPHDWPHQVRRTFPAFRLLAYLTTVDNAT